MKKFDKDGDGELSEDERVAAREAMQKHHKEMDEKKHQWLLEKFDKDGDGKLNEDEKAALEEARKAKHEEFKKAMLEKFDKDGDGELNEDEKEAMRKEMKDRDDRPHGPDKPHRKGEFKKAPEGGGDDEAPSVLGE